MALPRKLKYLNMFNDGLSYMGVVESVTLPKLTRKLENYRGGGMNGAAAIDLGLDDDALTVEWSVGGLPDVALWTQYAAPGADAVPLRFAGSYQRDDTGEIVAVEVVMRGRHKEIDGGENKQGENTSTKLSTVCTYLFPETPVRVSGFKRVIDEQAWLISKVTHNLNNNGFTTGLELEVKLSDVEYSSEENGE